MEHITYDELCVIKRHGYDFVFEGNLYTPYTGNMEGAIEPLEFWTETPKKDLWAVPTYMQVWYWLWTVKNIKIEFSPGGYANSVHVFISMGSNGSHIYESETRVKEFKSLDEAIVNTIHYLCECDLDPEKIFSHYGGILYGY